MVSSSSVPFELICAPETSDQRPERGEAARGREPSTRDRREAPRVAIGNGIDKNILFLDNFCVLSDLYLRPVIS